VVQMKYYNEKRTAKFDLTRPDNGKRTSTRLHDITEADAQAVRERMNRLLSFRKSGLPFDAEILAWIDGLVSSTRKKLERVGLLPVSKKKIVPTVDEWFKSYLSKRAKLKPRTRENYAVDIESFLGFIDGRKLLPEITAGDAEDFREHLIGIGLAPSTVGKRCSRIKHIFSAAIKHELVMSNPFAAIPTKGKSDSSRRAFVSQETIEAILAACSDHDFRLVFALARYAGIRIPSELGIRWDEVDWDAMTFVVHSPKTEHHPGKASRVVPIFPELYPYLRAAYDARGPEDVYAVALWPCERSNLRQKAMRIIRAAGVEVWPKLFVNLRSSRASELVNVEGFSEFTVSTWLGNSKEILNEHYLQAMQADIDRATGRLTSNLTQNLTSNLTSNDTPVVVPDAVASGWDKLKDVAKERLFPAIMGILEALNETSTTSVEAVPVSNHTPTGTRTPVSRMRT
jgi:integrase